MLPNQVQTVVKLSSEISEQLAKMKTDVTQGLTHTNYPNLLAHSYIQRAINLRQNFRQVAQAVQARENLHHVQKQKIQKSRGYLQGLQYCKAALSSKSQQSHLEVIDINQFYETPIQIEDWVDGFDEMESCLNQQLAIKHRKVQQYQRLLKLKAEREESMKVKTNLYSKVIPDKAKKIYEEVKEIAQFLALKEPQSIPGISNFKLSLLQEKLNTLRVNNTISVSFKQEGTEELQITIKNSNFYLYEKLRTNSINVNQVQTKFTVVSLPGEMLVIGIHRGEKFSNEQVFQRLINNQPIKPVFPRPKNQNQRDINQSYIHIDWLEGSLLKGLISPIQVINAIRQRVFSLVLRNHIIENMSKLSFYQVPILSEQSKKQYSKVNAQMVKMQISSSKLQRINFQQFLSQAHVPAWVDSFRATYAQLQKQVVKKSENGQNSSKMLTIMKLFQRTKLEQLIEPNLNTYYRGSFIIRQSKLEYMLIVPFTYPQKPSSIMITNWIEKQKESKLIINHSNIKSFKMNMPHKTISNKILKLEQMVNKQKFLLTEQNQSYLLLLQLNQLITLLYSQECQSS